MRLQHFMYQPFLAFEVVIELALSRAGRIDNVVRAGSVDSLFVK
jgi:hypothetical protein